MFNFIAALMLIVSVNNPPDAVETLRYSYAQIPNLKGQFTILTIEDGYSYFTDWGEKGLFESSGDMYCASFEGFVVTAPKEGLRIGDSWSCFDTSYQYIANSEVLVDGKPEKVKLITDSDSEIIYYSEERGILFIKLNSHDVVWYLFSEHGLFGSAWRAEQK